MTTNENEILEFYKLNSPIVFNPPTSIETSTIFFTKQGIESLQIISYYLLRIRHNNLGEHVVELISVTPDSEGNVQIPSVAPNLYIIFEKDNTSSSSNIFKIKIISNSLTYPVYNNGNVIVNISDIADGVRQTVNIIITFNEFTLDYEMVKDTYLYESPLLIYINIRTIKNDIYKEVTFDYNKLEENDSATAIINVSGTITSIPNQIFNETKILGLLFDNNFTIYEVLFVASLQGINFSIIDPTLTFSQRTQLSIISWILEGISGGLIIANPVSIGVPILLYAGTTFGPDIIGNIANVVNVGTKILTKNEYERVVASTVIETKNIIASKESTQVGHVEENRRQQIGNKRKQRLFNQSLKRDRDLYPDTFYNYNASLVENPDLYTYDASGKKVGINQTVKYTFIPQVKKNIVINHTNELTNLDPTNQDIQEYLLQQEMSNNPGKIKVPTSGNTVRIIGTIAGGTIKVLGGIHGKINIAESNTGNVLLISFYNQFNIIMLKGYNGNEEILKVVTYNNYGSFFYFTEIDHNAEVISHNSRNDPVYNIGSVDTGADKIVSVTYSNEYRIEYDYSIFETEDDGKVLYRLVRFRFYPPVTNNTKIITFYNPKTEAMIGPGLPPPQIGDFSDIKSTTDSIPRRVIKETIKEIFKFSDLFNTTIPIGGIPAGVEHSTKVLRANIQGVWVNNFAPGNGKLGLPLLATDRISINGGLGLYSNNIVAYNNSEYIILQYFYYPNNSQLVLYIHWGSYFVGQHSFVKIDDRLEVVGTESYNLLTSYVNGSGPPLTLTTYKVNGLENSGIYTITLNYSDSSYIVLNYDTVIRHKLVNVLYYPNYADFRDTAMPVITIIHPGSSS